MRRHHRHRAPASPVTYDQLVTFKVSRPQRQELDQRVRDARKAEPRMTLSALLRLVLFGPPETL